jgi:hypothetical protein
MKPICVPCQRFYKPEKCGIHFLEGMQIKQPAGRGNTEPEAWAPYKLWVGDKWRCAGCGAEIIVGTGPRPLGEHFEADFQEKLQRWTPELQVNDC